MKDFLIFSAVLGIAYLLSLFISNPEHCSFLSREHTDALRGAAIMTVLWCHAGKEYGIEGIQWVGGVGVALFLILSGYGCTMSYIKSGSLDGYWKRKLTKVFLPYWIIYLVLGILTKEPAGKIIEWLVLQNGQWYTAYLLICYVLFWVSIKLSERFHFKLQTTAHILLFLFGIWFAVDTLFFVIPGMPELRARQMLSFPFGMLLAVSKEKTREFIDKAWIPAGILGTVVTFIINSAVGYRIPLIVSNIISLSTVFLIAIFVLKLSEKIWPLFQNKTARLLGAISYECYLFNYFIYRIIEPGNPKTLYEGFTLVLLASFLFAYAYKLILRKVAHAK